VNLVKEVFMSVNLYSDKDISIVGNFAERIKLGSAAEISLQLAQQNVAAFNLRHSNLSEECNFVYVPDAAIIHANSLTGLVRELMTNSFTTTENTPANTLLSRIFINSIAIEFGVQLFQEVIGKQCRVKHNYNLINYIVEEKKHGYRIATYDDEKNMFRLFNAQKNSVETLTCNQLSAQQVGTLVYSIEKPILAGDSVFIENNILTAYKNNQDDSLTVELKNEATEVMVESLYKFKAKKLSDKVWRVSINVLTLLRELCPSGKVYV
jgi:hypothetical protein